MMRRLLLLLAGMLVAGCNSEQRGETCVFGERYAVVAEKSGANTRYLWLDPVRAGSGEKSRCKERAQ